jgi:hypothetical protein
VRGVSLFSFLLFLKVRKIVCEGISLLFLLDQFLLILPLVVLDSLGLLVAGVEGQGVWVEDELHFLLISKR